MCQNEIGEGEPHYGIASLHGIMKKGVTKLLGDPIDGFLLCEKCGKIIMDTWVADITKAYLSRLPDIAPENKRPFKTDMNLIKELGETKGEDDTLIERMKGADLIKSGNICSVCDKLIIEGEPHFEYDYMHAIGKNGMVEAIEEPVDGFAVCEKCGGEITVEWIEKLIKENLPTNK